MGKHLQVGPLGDGTLAVLSAALRHHRLLVAEGRVPNEDDGGDD